MVKALLNFCKVTCVSGLFVLSNYKLSEAGKPRSILHVFNLTSCLKAGIIYIEAGSWKLPAGKEKICISHQKKTGSCCFVPAMM